MTTQPQGLPGAPATTKTSREAGCVTKPQLATTGKKLTKVESNGRECVTQWCWLFDLFDSLWQPPSSGQEKSHGQFCRGIGQDIRGVSDTYATVTKLRVKTHTCTELINICSYVHIYLPCDVPFLDFIHCQVVVPHRQSTDYFQVWPWNQKR